MTPDNLLPAIRNSVRALIVQKNRLLLLRKDAGDQKLEYALPGGAQDPGETLQQALERECLEELGTRVRILDLLHVADFFKRMNTDPPVMRHQIEFLFGGTVSNAYVPRNGHRPDKRQIDVVWLPLEELAATALYSRSLAPLLGHLIKVDRKVYLGRIG